MLNLVIFTVLISASASYVEERAVPRVLYSAASPGQIRFAVENKYDDTGPGSKVPEHAYRAYKNLDEALAAYLEDPDTQLPPHEQSRAIQSLYGSKGDFDAGQRQKTVPLVLLTYNKYYNERGNTRAGDRHNDPFRVQKLKPVKANPLNIAHYTRQDEVYEPYNSNPRYWYSYDVEDPHTGDMKVAEESRNGDLVLGYYSFKDADGAQRTVRYEAGDKLGFRAAVHRVFNNFRH